MAEQTYRLVTRSDFDGVASAALLKKKGMIGDILFVHPKDVQDGKVAITPNDITTNVPYSPNAYIVFDHHASEDVRIGAHRPANLVLDADAPSAVHVVYRHYGGKNGFPEISEGLLEAVDRVDSAKLSKDEILNPTGWILLGFLMDARTGLGRFRNFGVSNLALMNKLVDAIGNLPVDEILNVPDVAERVALYKEHQELAKEQLKRCAKIHKNLIELDLRDEQTIYATNRFVIYALFPDCNISMHVLWGRQNQNVSFAIGKSILNRTSKTHIGNLCLKYGGGGHEAAGTCQIDTDKAAAVREELIRQINIDG